MNKLRKYLKKIFLSEHLKKSYFLVFIFFIYADQNLNREIFFRFNQVGYRPSDNKIGSIITSEDLDNDLFSVKDLKTGKIVFENQLQNKRNFKSDLYIYDLDFTDLKKISNYKILVNGFSSESVNITDEVFSKLIYSLLEFYKVQRCGYTDPLYHGICHRSDATKIIYNNTVIDSSYDVTGGWHDAGDYIKFLNTTAYSVYMMLFAYEFSPEKFSFDFNRNNVPDILEEAKIGLDWLLRCNYQNRLLIVQVQDLKDHEQGFRMPEDDKLENDRPAFAGLSKNLIGIYCASLALASKIWREKIKYLEFADVCLSTANLFYQLHYTAADIDTVSPAYQDKSFAGKLALGAIELYNVTKDDKFLIEAKKYARIAGSDHWWSWGDINSLAHYRIAKYDPDFADYIYQNLFSANLTKNSTRFNTGFALSWGTNNSLLGLSLQNILWKKLTSDASFDSLAYLQRDYILGRNEWGISFLKGSGTNFSKQLHHQILYLAWKLPGAVSSGPVTNENFLKYNISLNQDHSNFFNSEAAVYFDDYFDYITNEPTIGTNATALFVFAFYYF